MTDEDWVKVATVDDTVVAELLLKLKQFKQLPPPEPKPALSLEWSVRQRRSKAVLVPAKKQAPRASPTTPLSWSGATSVSGGFGGGSGSGSGGSVDGGPEEESSRRSPLAYSTKRSDISRSKVIGTSETVATKKARRKKTLAELKEEEDLLQKEGRQLKRDLATLRLNLEKERARNENFKRIKVKSIWCSTPLFPLGLQALPAVENGRIVTSELTFSDQLPKMASLEPVPALLPPFVGNNGGPLHSSPPNSCSEGKGELTAGIFVLPDLNIPFEENSSSDALCGVS